MYDFNRTFGNVVSNGTSPVATNKGQVYSADCLQSLYRSELYSIWNLRKNEEHGKTKEHITAARKAKALLELKYIHDMNPDMNYNNRDLLQIDEIEYNKMNLAQIKNMLYSARILGSINNHRGKGDD